MLLLCASAAPAFSPALTIPDYVIGETARVDIVTPFPFVVIDPEATEKLRQAEANRLPAFFRFHPAAPDESEAALKETVANHRQKFLDALEAVFNQRRIPPDRLETPRFTQVVRVYQRQNRAFTVLTNFARLWATGETDLELLLDWTAKLRAAQSNYIRVDNLPATARVGPVRFLTLSTSEPPVQVSTALERSVLTGRSNMVALTRARKDLQKAFAPEPEGVATFVARFLRDNCRFDEKLTLDYRGERTREIFAAHAYQPGESVVTSGSVVTPQIKAALTEYRIRSVPQLLQVETQKAQARPEGALAQLAPGPVRSSKERFYQWSLLAALGGLMLLVVSRLVRTSPPVTALATAKAAPPALPETVAPTIACPACAHPIALAVAGTESVGLPATQARAAMPHLAKWLASKFFRRLMWQRVYLIEAQRQAEAELRALEERLIQMQLPIKERLQAYENRVAELEKQLASAREESRQLIRSQIALLQKKLESERARQTDFN